jgi:hypothetical protein
MPERPQDIARDKLNNVLTGISIKSGLLQSKVSNGALRSELRELEELALQAVMLVRQL